MPSFAERPRSSQEALLRLEKGTASPTSQLNEATQIIGLDLALCASHPEINRAPQIQHNAAPKEEWVLRWLLKKLRMAKNYRVEPASFLLLRQLVDLIPPKTLATTLKDQKFLVILNDTISDLEEGVFAGVENGTAELLSSGSETSQTVGDLPDETTTNDKKGTKRKRARGNNEGQQEDAMDIDEPPQTPASCFLTFIRVLDCLYSLVMLANRTVGQDEVASSHLKHALKYEPESVATLLAKLCRVAALATTQFSHARKTTDLQHLLYVFPAILELWELRSSRRDDLENNSSNDWFAKYCFQHVLQLQLCVRSAQLDTDERAQVLQGIERLIALHVVLPARGGFFARGGSGIDYSSGDPDWSPVKPITDALRPILCDTSSSDQNTTESASVMKKKGLWKTADLLPVFFEMASRSVPRDTFRRQTHEAPWLEALFVAVAELAFSITKEESPATYTSDFVRLLEQLFRVVLDRKIQLSLPTLLAHATYTGLLKDELAEVQWSLTALLIELGVDIFLPNSGLPDSVKLLNALLEKIVLQWRSSTSHMDENLELIKNGIAIPLLRGFIAARDLPTFMQLWYEQLISVEETRAQNSKLDSLSVWEDDDLLDVYSEMMRNPLTGAHLNAQLRAASVEVQHEDGRVSDSPGSYAQFVILEAGLGNRKLNFEDANEFLHSVLETATSTLSSKQTLHWKWRLWRFARNLLENNLQSTANSFGNAVMKLADVAAKSIQRHRKDQMKKPRAALESFEAYRFSLIAIKESANSGGLDKFNSLTGEIANYLKGITTKDASSSMASPWNGRAETLDSPVSLALGYFLSLVRNPDVWNLVKRDIRCSLFEHILSLAASQYHASSTGLERAPSHARFLQAWASVVCHEYLLNAPTVAGDLVLVLSEHVKNDVSNRKLYIESLQRIPAPLITRRQRGVLLDLLQDIILQKDCSLEITVGVLSFMAKLADMPKSGAVLTSDWEPTWNAAKAVTLEGTEADLQVMKTFRYLHRVVIAKLLVLSEEERNTLFKKMYRKVISKASKLKSIDRDSMDCFFLRISLSQLWIHRQQLSDVLDVTELAACREKVFALVVAEVKSVKDQCKKQKLEDTITLIKVLDALEDFENLATNSAEVDKFLSQIESYVEKSVDSESPLRRLIRRRVHLGRGGQDKDIASPVMQCAQTLPLQQLYGQEQQLFIRATLERFRSMSVNNLTGVIQQIRSDGFSGDNAAYRLLVVSLAVASLPPIEDKDSSTAKELSSICTAVTESMHRSKSIEHFTFATECLDMLLRIHTRCIAQWNIDSILASIAVAASKSGPQISSDYAAPVYIRLCRLMGVLLSLHRQKLGGRFHVILPAMQRLLNCLFARSRKRSRSMRLEKGSHDQPYWLAPLQASHAVHFTRLLTSLCDPTVSAVSRPTQSGPGGQEGLTDQTKKAKRIAGQYLQYLIMEYAQSSLRGSMTPEVKATILPGLYTVLDVMSRETMRALNSGLDASGRAVFKGLYDDYVKFGKWNKG